jgi:hypothetical protein
MYARFLISGMTRDYNDVVKYPGRFNDVTYDETEGVIHKAMIYADTPAVNLEPVDTRIVVKNMSTQNVTLTFNTLMNLWINPGTTMRSTIYPGQIASFSSLDPAVTPTLTSTTPAECEVILVGFPEWPDTGPGWFCDVWAVGMEFNQAAFTPLTVHHDQTGIWTQFANGEPPVRWLHDCCGLAEDYYWAVGENFLDPAFEGYWLYWNGGAWLPVAVPDSNPQYGTWGYANDDFWSVGGVAGVLGEIWFRTGVNWVNTFSPEQEDRCFYHIHGIDSEDNWAVGECGMVYHWDGVSWTEWDSGSFPTGDNLYGVWQQDADNVWVCGGDTAWDVGGGSGVIYHLHVPTGVWTLQTIVDLPTMYGLWGFGDSDLYCVGNSDTIMHYNGAVWTAMTTPVSINYRGVFGCYPWSVWAVGHDVEVFAHIIHWDTVSWTDVWGTGYGDKLYGIKGVHVEL